MKTYFEEPFRDFCSGKYKSPYSLSEKITNLNPKEFINETRKLLIEHGYKKTYQGKFGSTWEKLE